MERIYDKKHSLGQSNFKKGDEKTFAYACYNICRYIEYYNIIQDLKVMRPYEVSLKYNIASSFILKLRKTYINP